MIRIIIPFLLSINIIFSTASVFACEEKPEPPKLSLAESKQLLADVQYLLSDKETIDYVDPRLNEILNKYEHKYKLFKIYKAFIEFDKSNKTKEDINRAADFLQCHRDNLHEETILREFFCKMTHRLLGRDLSHFLPEDPDESWDQGYKYIKIPLWLVRKYPYIVNSTNGPYTLTVNAKHSIKNLKEFNDFMSKFANIHHGYLTPMHGRQKINSYLTTKHFIDVISFNPRLYVEHDLKYGECARKSFKERMLYSEKDSYLTIENRLRY